MFMSDPRRLGRFVETLAALIGVAPSPAQPSVWLWPHEDFLMRRSGIARPDGSVHPVLLQRPRGAEQQDRRQQVEAHARIDGPAQALVAEGRAQQVAHPAEIVEAYSQSQQVVDQQEDGRSG